MSKQEQDILTGLREVLGVPDMYVDMVSGTVTEVNEQDWTCTVKLDNDVELYEVQLKAFKEAAKGSVEVPKLNTDVQLLQFGDKDWLVIRVEEIEKIVVVIDTSINIDIAGTTIQADKDGIILNGGKNGGVPISSIIDQNFDKILNRLSIMDTAIATALTAVGVGSAANGTTGATTYNNAVANAKVTISEQENKKVKH